MLILPETNEASSPGSSSCLVNGNFGISQGPKRTEEGVKLKFGSFEGEVTDEEGTADIDSGEGRLDRFFFLLLLLLFIFIRVAAFF